MRLVTFNVLHGRSTVDGRVDLARFADTVAGLEADVLALQEVDRHQPRSGGADLTAIAAEAMGAVDHRFVAALEGAPEGEWREPGDRSRPGAPGYGIALVSRLPVTGWEVLRLPTLTVPAPTWHPGARMPSLVREEPRVALAGLVEGPRGPVTVVNTHLSFVPWWNGRQLRTLARSLGDRRPVLLVGDLNMGSAKACRATGFTSLATADTFPAHDPRIQVDHVLTDGGLRVLDAGARRLPLSDHCALVVDLE